MLTGIIARADFSVDRERMILPSHLRNGEVIDPLVENLRLGAYTMDHIGLWYCVEQESKFLTGGAVFGHISPKDMTTFLSLNDGYALQRQGSNFIEKFGREKEYVLWGTLVKQGESIFVPMVYGAKRRDEVFILWDELKNDSFGPNRPALRFTTPGT